MIADVAKALGVANVLEGSVRKSGKTVRVTAQLVRADNGYPIWSDTYDRPLNDIFKIQDEIAGSVVNSLKVSLARAQAAARNADHQHRGLLTVPAGRIDQLFRGHLASILRMPGIVCSGPCSWIPRLPPRGRRSREISPLNIRCSASVDSRAGPHAGSCRRGLGPLRLDPELAAAYVALGRVLFEVDWNWDAAETEIQKGHTTGARKRRGLPTRRVHRADARPILMRHASR